MSNEKHANQIKSHQNQILNFFSRGSLQDIHLNFLNRNNLNNLGTRESWFGAHMLVQTIMFENNMPQYEKGAYYVTFNQHEDKEGHLAFVLRQDLVEYWLNHSNTSTYVLFVCDITNEIYEVPVSNIKDYYLSHDKKDICVTRNLFTDVIFALDDSLYSRVEKQDDSEYLQTSSHSYNPKYFEPKYIGNFTYAKYRSATQVKVFQYYRDGTFINEKTFRSIRELYDLLVKKGAYSKSYKSLQRDIASEMLIKLDNDIVVYMTTDVNSPRDELQVKVKHTQKQNPLYNPNEPVSKNNPETIKLEVKEPTKEYETDVDKVIEKVLQFDEQLEYHSDDFEEELQYGDFEDDAERQCELDRYVNWQNEVLKKTVKYEKDKLTYDLSGKA